jgi:hypothetical protein
LRTSQNVVEGFSILHFWITGDKKVENFPFVVGGMQQLQESKALENKSLLIMSLHHDFGDSVNSMVLNRHD